MDGSNYSDKQDHSNSKLNFFVNYETGKVGKTCKDFTSTVWENKIKLCKDNDTDDQGLAITVLKR